MDRPNASPVVDAGSAAPSPGPDDRVDEEILDELFLVMGDSGSDGLVKACELFLAGGPTRFSGIRAALAEGRFDDAAQGAHSLRGSAGAFGARRLSGLTLDLERLCREGDAGGAGPLLDEMESEFLIFRAILVARLGSLSR
jgi:HPt (histidine-containing phosphotransfer) domain-containing protein